MPDNTTAQTAAEFPEIVCLCGSTRFMDAYNDARKSLTLQGKIVLSVEIVTYDQATDPQIHDPETKRMLDELHLRKIDLADRVHILNVPTDEMPHGYIGESTANEIAYAKEQGKVITWLT